MIRQDIASVLFAVAVSVAYAPKAQAQSQTNPESSLLVSTKAAGKDVSARRDTLEYLGGALRAVGKDIS